VTGPRSRIPNPEDEIELCPQLVSFKAVPASSYRFTGASDRLWQPSEKALLGVQLIPIAKERHDWLVGQSIRHARPDGRNDMINRRRLSKKQSLIGLRVALRIISTWRATPAQACRILRISPATFRRASSDAGSDRRLDQDQQQRIGLVLAMHAILRTVFDNPANVHGFPGFVNHNPFFEGRSPLEIMAQGDITSIYETYKHIEQLQLADL
jgi:hypothetical protein